MVLMPRRGHGIQPGVSTRFQPREPSNKRVRPERASSPGSIPHISLLKTNFVGMHLRSAYVGLKAGHSIYGGENDVHENKGERLRHKKLRHLYMLLSRSILRLLQGASPRE